jgi:hypothetical protein
VFCKESPLKYVESYTEFTVWNSFTRNWNLWNTNVSLLEKNVFLPQVYWGENQLKPSQDLQPKQNDYWVIEFTQSAPEVGEADQE